MNHHWSGGRTQLQGQQRRCAGSLRKCSVGYAQCGDVTCSSATHTAALLGHEHKAETCCTLPLARQVRVRSRSQTFSGGDPTLLLGEGSTFSSDADTWYACHLAPMPCHGLPLCPAGTPSCLSPLPFSCIPSPYPALFSHMTSPLVLCARCVSCAISRFLLATIPPRPSCAYSLLLTTCTMSE